MSNSYFKFKKFTVHQDKCAMKVSTDACIQGAWTSIENKIKRVLDIGTGTGLLSLMLAQRAERFSIDAIELDNDAASQAVENIFHSPWKDRITVHQTDVKDYEQSGKYDMIICNPPFFQNSLQSDRANRNMARHNDSLSYTELLDSLDRLLVENGYASIMLPVSEFQVWENLLQANNWCVPNRLMVKPRKESNANRVVGICRRGKNYDVKTEDLCIYNEVGYTEQFTKLLQPFYLNL